MLVVTTHVLCTDGGITGDVGLVFDFTSQIRGDVVRSFKDNLRALS